MTDFAPRIVKHVTIGTSEKAILAATFPVTAAVLTAAASWVQSGTFNAVEIRIAAGGVILSALSSLGAWLGRPGRVVPIHDPASLPPDEGDPGQPTAKPSA